MNEAHTSRTLSTEKHEGKTLLRLFFYVLLILPTYRKKNVYWEKNPLFIHSGIPPVFKSICHIFYCEELPSSRMTAEPGARKPRLGSQCRQKRACFPTTPWAHESLPPPPFLVSEAGIKAWEPLVACHLRMLVDRWWRQALEDGLPLLWGMLCCLAKVPWSYSSSCCSSRKRFQGLSSGSTSLDNKGLWTSLDSDTSSATPCSRVHCNQCVLENSKTPGPVSQKYS